MELDAGRPVVLGAADSPQFFFRRSFEPLDLISLEAQ